MPKYLRMPIEVEASQFFLKQYDSSWFDRGVHKGTAPSKGARKSRPIYLIKTSNGPVAIRNGDWLVTESNGDKYPVNRELFRELFLPMLGD